MIKVSGKLDGYEMSVDIIVEDSSDQEVLGTMCSMIDTIIQNSPSLKSKNKVLFELNRVYKKRMEVELTDE